MFVAAATAAAAAAVVAKRAKYNNIQHLYIYIRFCGGGGGPGTYSLYGYHRCRSAYKAAAEGMVFGFDPTRHRPGRVGPDEPDEEEGPETRAQTIGRGYRRVARCAYTHHT